MCCGEALIRKFGWVFVLVTAILMAITPILAHIYIYDPWLSFHTDRSKFIWLGPFYLPVLSMWVNYVFGCRTNPGTVPVSFNPTVSTKTKQSKPRWCKTCMVYKPPRSHHCSITKKCVLKMDHYCPWFNNCIGHYNHGHFIRFLASVTISSISGLSLIGLRIYDFYLYQKDLAKYYSGGSAQSSSWVRFTPSLTDIEIIMLILVVIIFFALLFTVGLLFVWQLLYLANNVTTIESFENQSIASLQKAGVIPKDIVYPYDLGFVRNAQEVLGDYWYIWFLPFPPKGDGMSFKANSRQPAQWPPREYYLQKKYPHGKNNHKAKTAVIKNPLVRRGSEGYIVTPITAADREKMVQGTYEYPKEESSTDFDSLGETSDESDSELLFHRQERLKQE
jgi:hypothetical protein